MAFVFPPLSFFHAVNLDFEARVPVPFSIFPSSYKDEKKNPATTTTTKTHEELQLQLSHHKGGREGSQYSSYSATADLPHRKEKPPQQQQHSYSEEEVRITREEDRGRRPGVRREEYYREELKEQQPSPIDHIEREYRARSRSGHSEKTSVSETTFDSPPSPRPVFKETVRVDETIVESPKTRTPVKETFRSDEIVEIDRSPSPKHHHHHHHHHKAKMGHYDEDFRTTAEVDDREVRPSRRGSPAYVDEAPNSVTIPTHHIRIGDILILQGRPSQVIRISTSSATGQHRFLGVDLFTKQLHEESSSISNPAPSVIVQTMKGPILKQYRVLDLQDGHVVAITETGDVKQNLPVIDQSSLWERLQAAFDSGRGSVRVLVVNDNGREIGVDMKVLHGSAL
ncbi:hypothetical protein SLS53_005932 [Cytospora paraplurivora]|uniref:Translation elongation factor IF5A C-terminal domain-containing protein n=1 Tax=Cytospora paraplurivora TaxID=2898453 RepID=A0AAN9U3M0_9PEZI